MSNCQVTDKDNTVNNLNNVGGSRLFREVKDLYCTDYINLKYIGCMKYFVQKRYLSYQMKYLFYKQYNRY